MCTYFSGAQFQQVYTACVQKPKNIHERHTENFISHRRSLLHLGLLSTAQMWKESAAQGDSGMTKLILHQLKLHF